MTKNMLTKLAVATVGAALSFGVMKANPVQAATFTFTQGGFPVGGTLLLTFTGEDADSDQILERGELSSGQLMYSGSSREHPQPFSFSLINQEFPSESFLEAFGYVLNTGNLRLVACACDVSPSFYVSLSWFPSSEPPFPDVPQSFPPPLPPGSFPPVFLSYLLEADFSPGRSLFSEATSSQPPVLISNGGQRGVPEPSVVLALSLLGLGSVFHRRLASSRNA